MMGQDPLETILRRLAVRQGDEGVSVTYKVAGRTSMPSRADQQLIQIAQMDLPAQVVRAATPTLTVASTECPPMSSGCAT